MNGMHTTNAVCLTTMSQLDSATAQGLARPQKGFMHPSEVTGNAWLSTAEKREILASWASDLHAVPGAPELRQLESGAVVRIDDVLQGLKALDDSEGAKSASSSSQSLAGLHVQLSARIKSILQGRWPNSDDDNDPPPCPAVVTKPFGGPLSGGEFASPDLALAA